MSDKTPGHESIAAALAAFQAEMPTVTKGKRADVPTKSGGKYSYTYADLASITEVVAPILTRHGLAFTSLPEMGERGPLLRGVLLHTSGERLEGVLPIAGNTPQELGSSLTYMRRYLLGCLTGLVTDDDDDGHAASKAKQQQRQPRPAPPEPVDTGEVMTARTRGRLFALFADQGITDADAQRHGLSVVLGREITSRSDLTEAEARRAIASLEQRTAS